MFIYNSLRRLKLTAAGSFLRFLIMFTLAVIGPLVLFVLGFYNQRLIGPASMAWSFLAIALLISACVGGGFLMFKLRPRPAK
ncbi:MAG TPA: hypothetical protein VJ302_36235 [Blastocatellia bacterium]|nr:hypothetical protein [Blastocatellia bacterium]